LGGADPTGWRKFRQETSDVNDNLMKFMKIKPVQNRGGVLVELGPRETQLPAPTTTGTSELPVFKLKEILVPVDFTECTEKALAYAVPFARQFGATVTLLHVVEPAFVPASEMVDVDLSHESQRALERLRTRVASQVRCQTMIRRGGAEQEIIAVAKELACDLIILSTHGRSGLDRLLLGSTAERVVRRAGCPIFIVRPHEHDFIANDPTDWQEDAESLETEMEAEMRAGI
jgi:universal stress protein A